MTSTSRRTKRKWQKSDDSDWSIGWLEPHGPEFQSDDELDGSFAVLVPCYGRGRNDVVEDANKKIFSTIGNIPDGYSAGESHFS
ncbi:hypothetical protein CK203_110202 [Vitis vinifera]|uniref:Uncharacterized protein n=1 Tax=Vitis vinifera TaxID=29760 RepID=A0A438F8P0_VITVI|nr:hypothetical protein CK203_110202 [Vitis vinifera]